MSEPVKLSGATDDMLSRWFEAASITRRDVSLTVDSQVYEEIITWIMTPPGDRRARLRDGRIVAASFYSDDHGVGRGAFLSLMGKSEDYPMILLREEQ